MGQITINGMTIVSEGNVNISMRNGELLVNGVAHDVKDSAQINIVGNVNNIECDSSVTVHGVVIGDVEAGGSVKCGNVMGDVLCNGSVNAVDVHGDTRAGGSINIG